MPAKPLRMALGALLIQKKYDYSDRELVEQIQENPYYQYFIGLPGFQLEQPFAPSLLVEFRKHLTDEKLAGPALGRPGKDTVIDKRTEYIDSVDRIEARCKFGISKRSHGLGLILGNVRTYIC
ncbi:Transposase domain [Butyrivibrio sp. INlla16]|nr:Transposase domain [Butyrivibrio sp. INlla16]